MQCQSRFQVLTCFLVFPCSPRKREKVGGVSGSRGRVGGGGGVGGGGEVSVCLGARDKHIQCT